MAQVSQVGNAGINTLNINSLDNDRNLKSKVEPSLESETSLDIWISRECEVSIIRDLLFVFQVMEMVSCCISCLTLCFRELLVSILNTIGKRSNISLIQCWD